MPQRFRIPVMALVGVETSDRRTFEAFTWREPPLSLMWQREDSHGDTGFGGSPPTVQVGIIDAITLTGDTVSAEGELLEGSSVAADFMALMQQQGRVGVSVDASATEVYIEVPADAFEPIALPEDGEDAATGEPVEVHIEAERQRFPTAEIMGATVVHFPAFAGAYLELADAAAPAIPEQGDAPEVEAAAIEVRVDTGGCAACDERGTLVASGGPLAPPRSWFEEPEPDVPTPLTITDDGRVYGHLALWGTCHVGISNQCVTPPQSASNYARFHLGAVRVEEGVDLPVGHITMNTGHADLAASPAQTLAHYDNTGTVVADVVASDGRHGVWLSGALRPDVSDEQVRALRAASLSGDWRRQGGALDLMAALAVNVPGFPVPRARVASGAPAALVAAVGVPQSRRAPEPRPRELRVAVDSAAITAAVEAALAPLRPVMREAAKRRLAEVRGKLAPR